MRGLRARLAALLAACLLAPAAAAPAEELPVRVAPDTEVPVERHPGRPGDGRLYLWLPSERGLPEGVRAAAAALARRGPEVWVADLLAARFLPLGSSGLRQVPATDVKALVEAALARGARHVLLVASGEGAALALAGARLWQLARPGDARLAGALLLHPNLYVETPEPGAEARYLPVARATNLGIVVIQPALSPWWWRLDALVGHLEAGGSTVWRWALPGVRDRFHFRPDATALERRAASLLPAMLDAAGRLLVATARPRRPPPLAADAAAPAPPPSRAGRMLRPYRGDPQPPPLDLPLLGGGRRSLADVRGRVVLVNFWASWCPPCVHEMPSMERLYRRLAGRPFEILAVNMAEDEATVRRFLAEKVRVSFPILLDRDGAALRRWKVFAFPTSYLLDARGRIRYAVYGAIDWDGPEALRAIGALLDEARDGGPRR